MKFKIGDLVINKHNEDIGIGLVVENNVFTINNILGNTARQNYWKYIIYYPSMTYCDEYNMIIADQLALLRKAYYNSYAVYFGNNENLESVG